MKYNKIKLRLALIVPALALAVLLSGCPVSPGSKAPGFLEVGGIYTLGIAADMYGFDELVVLEIRDGWVLVSELYEDWSGFYYYYDRRVWVNTVQISTIRKIEAELEVERR